MRWCPTRSSLVIHCITRFKSFRVVTSGRNAPIPSRLAPRPRRPGVDDKVGPADHAKEAGMSVIDWVDERTSLTGCARALSNSS